MQWKKLGKIFTPSEHKLPNNCVHYAKSPQAVVFDNFVRVYFSSTENDVNKKLLSRVLSVDFDKEFKNILAISKNEIVPLGPLGSFDEHGIFPFSVFRDEDKICAYTSGWSRRVAVSVDGAIGYAESLDNGLTFTKLGQGPILGPTINEPFMVADAYVNKFNGTYYMWYIFGLRWIVCPKTQQPQRVYKIAMANSVDGINWTRNGKCIIQDVINEDECQALPTVFYRDNKFHMYFCYRNALGFRNGNNSYQIGYAYSSDLKTWIRNDSNAGISKSKSGWDSEMMCYPNTFECDGNMYMLYNGNQFGKDGFGIAKLEEHN
jgi:sucrose-6-phosphate hydrolase SacC (GH32 family)